jgi:hypothetical protein
MELKKMRSVTILLCLISSLAIGQEKSKLLELNTILMESTFRLQGPDKNIKGNTSFGTAFLIGKPLPAPSNSAYYVLVTAAHVLDGIDGDTAQLGIPTKTKTGGFELIWRNIPIREQGKNLYVTHKDYATDKRADAAAIYVDMPDDRNAPLLTMSFLATDKMFEEFELHPGDELFTLGFPLCVGTEFGFPILRSGTISSYPITPTTVYKNLLYDVTVFEGNSSGPVYFVDRNRTYGGQTYLGGTVQFVVGLLMFAPE